MMTYRRIGTLVLTLMMVALWAHVPAWAQDSGTGQDTGAAQVSASAVLTDSTGQQVGTVRFVDQADQGTVRVMVQVQNMSPGFQELVLTSVGQCDVAGTPPYSSAGEALNLNDQQFPFRAGDLLPVYVMQDGTGEMSFLTDRFTTADLLDADGSAVVVRLGAVLMGIPAEGGEAGGGQTAEMTATPEGGEAGGGQTAEMTATPEGGAAGGEQTAEMTATPEGGAAGGGQTAEMTATPEGGEAGGGETAEMTATPEGGEAGGGETAEMTATPEAGAAEGQAAEMTSTPEAGAAEGQAAEMTATPEAGAAEGQTAEMTATPEAGQAGGAQGQPSVGVVGEYFACGVVMQGDVEGATTAGGAQGGAAGGGQTAEMTATPEGGAAGGAAQGEPITVSLVDGKIEMPASIPGGSVTFQITNNGTMEHGFVIEGVDDASFEKSLEPNLQPGESGTLQVDLQAGAYRVYCPVDGHAEQGMQLDLTVTEGAQ